LRKWDVIIVTKRACLVLQVNKFDHINLRFRFTWGDRQPDCLADRPVTGPRQSTINP